VAKRCTKGDLPLIVILNLALPLFDVIFAGFCLRQGPAGSWRFATVPALTSVM